MRRKQKFHIPPTPEFLRDVANRAARRISSFGWRPSRQDIAELKACTGDATAYKIALRGWRAGGFRMRAVRKLAGRGPAHEVRTYRCENADAANAS
jgi:hypothetical protein